MNHQQKVKSTTDLVPEYAASCWHNTGVPRPGLLRLTATGRSDGCCFGKKLNWGVDQMVPINTLRQTDIGFTGMDSNTQVSVSEQHYTAQTRKSVV